MKSSDETFDYNCTVCHKRNRVSEAVKYCQECQKYMCTSCLEQHGDYMEDHTLEEPSAVGSGAATPTERCRKHSGEIIKLWCKQHDEVLCSTCAFLDHRSCTDVLFISNEISNIYSDVQLRQVVQLLEESQGKAVYIKDDREAKKEKLFAKKMEYTKRVEEHKEKLIRKIKNLGKSAIEEINNRYEENLTQMEEKFNKACRAEKEISKFLRKIENANENKAQLFVMMKMGEKMNSNNNKMLDEASSMDAKMKEDFQISMDTEDYLNSLNSLGSFVKKSVCYKVTSKRMVTARVRSDKNDCDLESPCFLKDGSILVTDFDNMKLKRLNSSTYTVIDLCDLPGKPRAVCCVGQQEVAVSLGDSETVQFVSVGKTMCLTRSIALDHYCLGIGYSEGELFISDLNKNVIVYDLLGTRLRTLGQTPSGEELFTQYTHLTVTGDKIYTGDRERGFICTDKQGTELFRYKGTQVKYGYGVCTDGQGGLFLCGYQSHNVVQVGADGEELGVVLTQTDGLNKPQSVCFDSEKKKLIVTNFWDNNMLVFDMELKSE